LISGNSPYDRLVFGGDSSALSEPAWRGVRLFFSERLRCSSCHAGFNFEGSSTDAFHNTGLYDVDGHGAYPSSDTGLQQKSRHRRDMGRFRVPTLRNIALTAPYMHDGSMPTLDAVIDAYAAGGRARMGKQRAARSVDIRPFALTADEKRDLIAFLDSLTDESFLHDPRFSDPRLTRPHLAKIER
jgi:cytochrome c peroxidase